MQVIQRGDYEITYQWETYNASLHQEKEGDCLHAAFYIFWSQNGQRVLHRFVVCIHKEEQC